MTSKSAISVQSEAPLKKPAAERAHILFLMDEFMDGCGGAEGALVRMVRHLPKDRFRCSVATFRQYPSGPDAFDCPFHVFPLKRTYDWNALKTAFRFRSFLRSEKVDIVHSFFETSDLWGGFIAKTSGRGKLISSRRDMGILRRPKHSLFYRILGPMYDQVHAVSDQVRSFAIREDHLNPNKVITVYNGIELELFDAQDHGLTRKDLGLDWASHLILGVGNVRHVKGFDIMMRAAAIVCRDFPDACFLIVGDFHERAHYEELLALRQELGLTRNFVFLGKRTDVGAVLNLGDIFCLPSRSEGLSNALLEAMASRLPAVATRVGGNAEVVEDGSSGTLVDSEDVEAMARAISTQIREPDLAAKMGRAGREIIERKFTVAAMVEHMGDLYDGLLYPR